jgi:hypothetical protein
MDANYDGLPDDWEATYFGGDSSKWPSPQADSDGDGMSNLQEFLAGTDPTNPESVLRTTVVSTPQGWRLNWNTQPGSVYQVQSSTDLAAWANLGGPRFAPGSVDSIPVTEVDSAGYFRVVRMR